MIPLRSILVATDFSVDGNNAVRRAAFLAGQHDARLSILHVVNPAGFNPLRGWYRQSSDIDLDTAQVGAALRRLAAEIAGRHDVVVQTEVRVGDVDVELLRASAGADLLVLGERGKSPLKDLVIGRTADRLFRTCRTPLLVVKQAVQGPYRRVLVPVDFTPGSNAAIRSAAALATGAGIQVFHVLGAARDAVLREAEMPATVTRESRAREEAGAGARMRRGVARLGLDSRSMSFALGRGPVVQATLRQAQRLDADLIVAGKQRRSTVAGFFPGSAGSRLLSASRCDTLIIPHPLRMPEPSTAAGSPRPKDHDPVIDTTRPGRGAAALNGALTHARTAAAATPARPSSLRGPAWAAVARVYP